MSELASSLYTHFYLTTFLVWVVLHYGINFVVSIYRISCQTCVHLVRGFPPQIILVDSEFADAAPEPSEKQES